MTTLIYSRIGSDNARRCDAKCYEATCVECDCVCGGMNHGKGLQAAMALICEMTGEMLKAIDARGGYVPDDLLQKARQGSLL